MIHTFALFAAAVTLIEGGGYFPVMTRLQDGRLAAVFRGGAPHIGRGGRLDWITSSDSGKSWSKPRTLVESPEDDRNPALGQLRDGTIILAYCILSGYDETGTRLSQNRSDRVFDGVYTIHSSDGGKTWTRASSMPGRLCLRAFRTGHAALSRHTARSFSFATVPRLWPSTTS